MGAPTAQLWAPPPHASPRWQQENNAQIASHSSKRSRPAQEMKSNGDFVHRYQGRKHHWIGLHRAGGDERWMWADGRTFTNRSIAGTGPCGYLSSTGFSSTFCHDVKLFVCIRADSFVLWRNGMQPR
ncbi:C-type lectin domain family 2 member H-like [Lagopus leucura]|uniref:C-type lectin domain family 2 member H-like n=1 Tax=Lagopus leucura TaxID=30410 RepID=UPI001C674A37|nr:C-type lectin domain family 2 member H-like [Lagopus leucura]